MIKRVLMPVLLILLGFGAFAQLPPDVNTLVLPSFDSVPAGSSFDLCVQFQVPEKYHLTENFLEVRLGEIEGFSTSFQQITSGEFEKGEIVRRGTVIMKLPVEVSDTIGTGTYTLKVTTSYQICREVQPETCFPPKDVEFSISITVLGTGADPIANTVGKSLADKFIFQDAILAKNISDESVELSLDQKLKNALAQGSALAFLLVFVAGFLTSLTPCVYPMIPITISYIGGRSTGQGKFRGFILSLFYVLGLALVYALLGVAAALTGSLFGSITQIPAVIGGVALIFGIMGLSMLGLFDIQLPSSFQSRMQSGGPKSGFLGAVVMGAVAGLVAAPCAGPVIVALMTYIASTGKVIFGFTLMMSFAAGMGILFIVLGTFSGLLSALPSAGMWMAKVKKTFGVIMIGAAIFIAKPILPPPVFGILTGIGIVLLGAAMGAFRPIGKDDEYKKDMLKGCALILVFWGIYCIVTLLPVPGRIIPDQVVSGTAFQGPVEIDFWRSNLKEALSEAKLSEKMLIVDFGAEWCRACKELEHKTFSDTTVIARLKEMIAVKVDCTKSRDPNIKALQREYSVTGLPTVIVLD
ncbi:sulfite exporter TauE/SafE family protein, partial [bacterium]|nr:sulfite exporter TauE/SafE family protein [bacterium]